MDDKFLNLAEYNFNKYESYIRIGHKADGSDLEDFPTPSGVGRTLHDVDKDAYTDLRGYTHRNRVRHDVEEIALTYNILSPTDEAYILNRISPQWIYVELTDKKTKKKALHKMYASDKEWNVNMVAYDITNSKWIEQDYDFAFTLVEE
jgi:hypothetical protein